MSTSLKIIQIVIAVMLMAAILLQSRGAGLSGVFGGSSGVYRTKRGIEKSLFIATIVLAVLFFGVAIISLIKK
jgi:preprotein translocase subunit SecG